MLGVSALGRPRMQPIQSLRSSTAIISTLGGVLAAVAVQTPDAKINPSRAKRFDDGKRHMRKTRLGWRAHEQRASTTAAQARGRRRFSLASIVGACDVSGMVVFSPRRLRCFLLIVCAAVARGADANYTYYLTGNAADAPPARTEGALLLMGGGTDVDEAFRWFIRKAGGGDIVVLRASGADGYNNDLFTKLGGVDSVETILFHRRAASEDPRVLEIIRAADGIWLAKPAEVLTANRPLTLRDVRVVALGPESRVHIPTLDIRQPAMTSVVSVIDGQLTPLK